MSTVVSSLMHNDWSCWNCLSFSPEEVQQRYSLIFFQNNPNEPMDQYSHQEYQDNGGKDYTAATTEIIIISMLSCFCVVMGIVSEWKYCWVQANGDVLYAVSRIRSRFDIFFSFASSTWFRDWVVNRGSGCCCDGPMLVVLTSRSCFYHKIILRNCGILDCFRVLHHFFSCVYCALLVKWRMTLGFALFVGYWIVIELQYGNGITDENQVVRVCDFESSRTPNSLLSGEC